MEEKSQNDNKNTVKKILILSANPITTRPPRFDKEISDSEDSILRAKYGDQFNIQAKLAVGLREFRRGPLDYDPDIVHFIGHGTKEGLMVEGEQGAAVPFSSEAISGLFKLFSKHVKCVILSACYSEPQAVAISQHIDYVIGMRSEIKDRAAIEFAVGFYDALGAGRTVEDAFEFGRIAILQMYPDLPEHLIPVLKKKTDQGIPKVESVTLTKKSSSLFSTNKEDVEFSEVSPDKKSLNFNVVEENEGDGEKTTVNLKTVIEMPPKGKKKLLLKISISLIILLTTLVFIDKGFIGLFNDKLPKITMIRIPEGNFLRGTSPSEIQELLNDYPDWEREWFNNETPQEEIYLNSFDISKFEITNKQYIEFLKDNPEHVRPAYLNEKNFNGSDQPVVGVSWKDAAAFCDWLSEKTKEKYRLPTEVEWEKAARGTDGRFFPWGNEEPDINKANFMNQHHKTVSVKEKAEGASAFGLMNMAGNVWEWCNDWYILDSEKVVRGGSWENNVFFLRCSARHKYPPNIRNEFIGFRIVRIQEN